jgi:aryl-alcohol dehydrogenase-like predicted oxidoreductase
VAVAWTLAKPGIASVIVGARNSGQMARNLTAADLKLGTETVARLDAITEPMRQHFGTNADMWCNARESRIR